MALELIQNTNTEAWAEIFRSTRNFTEKLCQPLAVEDYCIQSSPEVSPPKWHLAHTTWFFEKFILAEFKPNYRLFNTGFDYLFNSYYDTVGAHFEKSRRGLLSRPTVAEVYRYRAYVDGEISEFLSASGSDVEHVLKRIEIGIHHEQQHQELLLTDIKHLFWTNPSRPSYMTRNYRNPDESAAGGFVEPAEWIAGKPGLASIGLGNDAGRSFGFDNEKPAHLTYLSAHRIQNRLITQGEYAEFIEDGGYHRPDLWLSDGWAALLKNRWEAPLYWERTGGSRNSWSVMTLAGPRALEFGTPVTHISFYEADAFARWRGARLPTEAEWEVLAAAHEPRGNFAETGIYHPVPLHVTTPSDSGHAYQIFGDVWEWTASAYLPYPRFRPLPGSLGEYNGKFMSGQMVLRGGSCVTPEAHIRASYRNFFPPETRWQFSGIRLASD